MAADTADVAVTPMPASSPGVLQIQGEFVTGFEDQFYSFTAEAGEDIFAGFAPGATDPCSAIDARVEVLRPDGSSYGGGRLVGCARALFGTTEVTGTYFVRLRSFDLNLFDYELVVQLN